MFSNTKIIVSVIFASFFISIPVKGEEFLAQLRYTVPPPFQDFPSEGGIVEIGRTSQGDTMTARPNFSYVLASDSNIFTMRAFGIVLAKGGSFLFVAQTDCGNARYRNISSGFYNNGEYVGKSSEPDMQWIQLNNADNLLARSMMASCEIAAKEAGINWEWGY